MIKLHFSLYIQEREAKCHQREAKEAMTAMEMGKARTSGFLLCLSLSGGKKTYSKIYFDM